MTISSTTVKVSYSGNSSTTVFAYTFKILDDDEIQVIIRTSDGTETIKTKTTHYTVSGVGSAGGGNITFLTAPVTGQTVVLKRNTTKTQETDYVANDPFPANSHEEALDRVTMIAQEIQEELQRSIKLSKTNTMTSTEFNVGAADRANKILAFDTNGEISVTQELGTNRGNWSSGVTFNARDIVKDSSNNNVYLCNTTHTSTGSTPISSNADVAKWDLIVDAQSATNSANAASNHASNSSNFANNSSNSANASANHASNSSNFANNASNSASNAANSLASVSANANAAANSASNASNFANNSSNSANSASNHSANSSNFANNSSNHASNSSNFANNSSNSANSASASASTATTQAGFASSNAATATTQAGFATSNATAALGYSSNSSNFANNSSNFANTASNAANAANAARDAALTAADNFDDVYLGSKTTDPTLDNDGDALTAGDLYYNSVGTVLKYYTGSAWVAITSGGITDLVQDTSPQLGGMLDVNGQSIGDGTLELVKFAETASAVNEITVTNSATGNAPEIASSGDDTNIDLKLTPKGTGKLNLDGIKFPNADGSAGQALTTNGSGILSFSTISADGTADWDTTVKTSGFTATANKGYFCNTTSSAFTVTLPSSPSAGDEIVIVDYAGTFATNNLNITSTPKINGSDNDVKLTTNREATRLVYIDSTQGWLAYSGVNEGTSPSLTDNPPTYSVDFLVIAGGGGGGGSTGTHNAGGGGAGGYRNSFSTETSGGGGSSEASLTFNVGTVYTVTVGAGGAGGISDTTKANNGVDSSISGTGITTITSTGGGAGGTGSNAGGNRNGNSGGSGGGGGGTDQTGGSTGGSGTANQGYGGGNGVQPGNIGGTGGGASAAGISSSNYDSNVNGGAGLASSITGSSVTRANGGGTLSTTTNSSNATANTGNGGDGETGAGVNGYNGGSGVVILRMPTANYSNTTTGSPTVSTSGSDTILVFNSSGSYTG
jgi:hypothetical protein